MCQYDCALLFQCCTTATICTRERDKGGGGDGGGTHVALIASRLLHIVMKPTRLHRRHIAFELRILRRIPHSKLGGDDRIRKRCARSSAVLVFLFVLVLREATHAGGADDDLHLGRLEVLPQVADEVGEVLFVVCRVGATGAAGIIPALVLQQNLILNKI